MIFYYKIRNYLIFTILFLLLQNKFKYKYINLFNLDKPNPNYLILTILFLLLQNLKSIFKLFTLINLDKTI